MSDDKLYDLVAEWDQRRQQGEELPAAALCNDCPELIPELEKRIASVKATDWLVAEDDDDDDDFLSLPPQLTKKSFIIPSSVSLEQFTDSIVAAGLLTSDQIQRVAATDANDLAAKLILARQLTGYQVKQICDGNAKGLVLGNYVILDKIGAGGMGAVFKARHKRMDRVVALKLLPEKALESATALERFHREAKAAARLTHSNIVVAHDADEFNGTHFLVMEFVDCHDLSSLVKQKGPMPVGKAVDCIIQAAKGLEYAHGEGVIHRDIKPANLLLNKKGVVKILDMGLARLEKTNGAGGTEHFTGTQAELTTDGAVLGTIDYLAPEQAMDTHHADARSDIYSLGCTMHYLLTGKPIFSGSSLIAKMLAHREKAIPSLHKERKDVPQKLANIFQKMVSKNPDERYPNMTALLEELEALAGEYEDTWRREGGDETTAAGVESHVDLQSRETSSAGLGDTLELVPKDKRQEKPVVPERQPAGNRSRLFAGGLVGLLMVGLLGYWLFGIIFKVETPDGIIQVETNVSDIEIYVDNEKVVYITDPKDKTKIRVEIPKGAEKLRVSKEGFEADVAEFQLKTLKGPVKVSFVPVEKELPSVTDVEREVAEWVLGVGGTVDLVGPAGESLVVEDGKLPKERFFITIINLHSTPTKDADLARLTKLSRIKTLYLDCTQVTGEGLKHLAPLKTLAILGLGNVKGLGEVGFDAINQFENLYNLTVGQTDCTDEQLMCLTRLSNLELLNIAGNPKLTNHGIEFLLKRNPQLQQLQMQWDDKGGTYEPSCIVHAPKLQRLSISASQLNGAALTTVANHPTLSWLHVEVLTKRDEESMDQVAALIVQRKQLTDVKLVGNSESALSLIKTHVDDLRSKRPDIRLVIAGGDYKKIYEPQVSLENPSVGGDPHRTLAEWVLGIGGEVAVYLKGQSPPITISAVEDLPNEAFTVNDIVIPANSDFTDDDLAELARLCQGIDLHYLRLEKTAITDDGLAHLAGLSIRQLFIAAAISDAGIEYVKQVRNLQNLTLDKTKVSDAGVREIAKIHSLESLNLIEIPITDTALEHLKELPNLQVLNVSKTSISDEGLRHLAVHTKLRSLLTIQCEQISDVGMKHLSGLTAIERLEMHGTKVTDAGIVELANLKKLSQLALTSCKISDAGVKAISEQFPNLNVLVLSGTDVTDAGLEHLQKLNKLNTLHVVATSITDAGLKTISEQLPNLNELSLDVTDVTDAGLEYLIKLTKLEHVDLRGTKVTAQGVTDLKKALPNCKVEWDGEQK